jgi:hypothetical protein
MPRSTEYRIHNRALALRAEAEELSLGGGQKQHPLDASVSSGVGVQPHHAGGAAFVEIDDLAAGP